MHALNISFQIISLIDPERVFFLMQARDRVSLGEKLQDISYTTDIEPAMDGPPCADEDRTIPTTGELFVFVIIFVTLICQASCCMPLLYSKAWLLASIGKGGKRRNFWGQNPCNA